MKWRCLIQYISETPIVVCAAIWFQYCAVLLELEEARGNHVTKDEGTADISTTSGVIDKQLSFHSVEELHKQNQCLIQKLGELEEEKEKQQSQKNFAR